MFIHPSTRHGYTILLVDRVLRPAKDLAAPKAAALLFISPAERGSKATKRHRHEMTRCRQAAPTIRFTGDKNKRTKNKYLTRRWPENWRTDCVRGTGKSPRTRKRTLRTGERESRRLHWRTGNA